LFFILFLKTTHYSRV